MGSLWGDDDARAHGGAAEALSEAEEVEAFAQHCDREAARHPEWPDYLLRQGLARYERGDLAGARTAVDAALARNPKYRDALITACCLAARAGDAEAVERHVAALLQAHPRDARARHGEAGARALLGDDEGAMRAIDAALELSPLRIELRYVKAALAARTDGRLSERLIEEAAQVAPALAKPFRRGHLLDDPSRGSFRRRLARALGDAGAPHRAAFWVEEALSFDLDRIAHHIAEGEVAFAERDYERALERFEQAIALAPSAVAPRLSAVCALTALERVTEAIDHVKAALSTHPQYPDLHQRLGALLIATNELEGSERALARAMELNARNPDALYAMGLLKAALRDDAAARELWERALSLGCPHDELRLELGLACADAGEKERAVELLGPLVGRRGMGAAALGLAMAGGGPPAVPGDDDGLGLLDALLAMEDAQDRRLQAARALAGRFRV